jgi:hypothetical protein
LIGTYSALVVFLVSALREQIFDIAIAECESDIQPNRVPDDLSGELAADNEMVLRHLTRQPDTRATVRVTRPRSTFAF